MALRCCQALFLRFDDVEWSYRKLTAEEQAATTQWWKKVPHMAEGGAPLSERWSSELGCIVTFAEERLRLCRACNDACIRLMPVPESYVAGTLSKIKNAGDVLSRSLHKALNRDQVDPWAALAAEGLEGLEPGDPGGGGVGGKKLDKLALMEVLNGLEKASLVWERKSAAEGDKKKKDAERHAEQAVKARAVIEAVKGRFPGLGQTQLEQDKMSNNRDVGSAVLEAYSRILESRASQAALTRRPTRPLSLSLSLPPPPPP